MTISKVEPPSVGLPCRRSTGEHSMPADPEVEDVLATMRLQDPNGDRIAATIRRTFDQLYDGRRTGRYRWEQLHKTEKTHCGTLLEINLQREFVFADGLRLDYLIAGHEVDCKYSQTLGGWMIPQEAMGHLCFVATADDQAALWSFGLIRICDGILTRGHNRDTKRSLSAAGRHAISWLFKDADLPPNVLLQLPRAAVDALMALRHGTQRINQLFRLAQGRRITGSVIETVGQQDDPKRRVRKGDARSRLQQEGVIILGDYSADQAIARQLGLPVPREGEFVSSRVVPATRSDRGVARIDGSLWRIALSGDPVTMAPATPGQRQ